MRRTRYIVFSVVLLAGSGATGVKLVPLTTVFDDDVKDKLKGDKGRDWYLADPSDDEVKGKKGNEVLTDIDPAPLHAGVQNKTVGNSNRLSSQALNLIFQEAVIRWAAAGVDPDSIGDVTLQISDLPGSYLGYAGEGVITIDVDAAGNGWFIDSTPRDDAEFTNGAAPDGIDLLTVVMHEVGHLLGLDHSHDDDDAMAAQLLPGVRRLPTEEG